MTVAFPKPEPRVKERKPLRAKTRLRPRRWGIRPKRIRRLDGPGADIAFLDWVRGEACVASAANGIDDNHHGRTEAHHAGKNPGIGMKAPDRTAIPLCSKHHAELTAKRGTFRLFAREALRDWQDCRSAETLSRYLSHGGRHG